MERIVTIHPVFLELIEQIGVKIGYGKVILSTWRMSCHNFPRISRVDWENGKLGEDWIWHVRIYFTCWINCQNLIRFSRIPTFNEKWKIAVNIRYVKLGCIVYARYKILNCFWFSNALVICTLDRRNCTLYSRKRILGRG